MERSKFIASVGALGAVVLLPVPTLAKPSSGFVFTPVIHHMSIPWNDYQGKRTRIRQINYYHSDLPYLSLDQKIHFPSDLNIYHAIAHKWFKVGCETSVSFSNPGELWLRECSPEESEQFKWHVGHTYMLSVYRDNKQMEILRSRNDAVLIGKIGYAS